MQKTFLRMDSQSLIEISMERIFAEYNTAANFARIPQLKK